MKKDNKLSKADLVCIGILLFAVLVAAVFGIVKLCLYISYHKKYGDIIDLAEKNGLKIIRVEANGELGAEIYISENAVNSAVMEKYYNFAKALSDWLDNHSDIFGKDGKPVPIKLSFGGVENQSATHSTAVSCDPADTDSGYEFTDYYIRFETDFEGISYIKNAKRLYLPGGKLGDLKGIENFAGLEYLYADIEDDMKGELEKKLPDCKIEYKDQVGNVLS